MEKQAKTLDDKIVILVNRHSRNAMDHLKGKIVRKMF